MSQLTTYPLADGFKATLDQAYNGTAWTIYSDSVPNITRPSGVFTYLVIAPKTSNQQIVKISGMDTIAKTFTVSSTTVKKGAGTNYSTTTHAIWTEIIISSNYSFWEDLKTAINDNADDIATNTSAIATINNTINSNINSIQAWSYVSAIASGTDTYTASLTPDITEYTVWMGVTIKFTNANSGNSSLNLNGLWWLTIVDRDWLDIAPWVIRAGGIYELSCQSWSYWTIQTENFATTNNKGIIEIATTAEVLAWTDTTRAVTPEWLRYNTNTQVITFTWTNVPQDVFHSLGRVPKLITFYAVWPNGGGSVSSQQSFSQWAFDSATNSCVYSGSWNWPWLLTGNSSSYAIRILVSSWWWSGSTWSSGYVNLLDDTRFSIARDLEPAWWTTVNVVAVLS